jgi:hypothetical protein
MHRYRLQSMKYTNFLKASNLRNGQCYASENGITAMRASRMFAHVCCVAKVSLPSNFVHLLITLFVPKVKRKAKFAMFFGPVIPQSHFTLSMIFCGITFLGGESNPLKQKGSRIILNSTASSTVTNFLTYNTAAGALTSDSRFCTGSRLFNLRYYCPLAIFLHLSCFYLSQYHRSRSHFCRFHFTVTCDKCRPVTKWSACVCQTLSGFELDESALCLLSLSTPPWNGESSPA